MHQQQNKNEEEKKMENTSRWCMENQLNCPATCTHWPTMLAESTHRIYSELYGESCVQHAPITPHSLGGYHIFCIQFQSNAVEEMHLKKYVAAANTLIGCVWQVGSVMHR